MTVTIRDFFKPVIQEAKRDLGEEGEAFHADVVTKKQKTSEVRALDDMGRSVMNEYSFYKDKAKDEEDFSSQAESSVIAPLEYLVTEYQYLGKNL